MLAAPTGCGGIVKMDQLDNIGDLSSLSKTLSNALGLGRWDKRSLITTLDCILGDDGL